MTAEVAIMNKLGVALAADSAVTISGSTQTKPNNKIYNSANKLFTLSKYHPVGVMIFDAAEFMGVPWEVLIKMYREHLGNTAFDTIQEYADNLFAYLEQHWPDPKSDDIYILNVATQVANGVMEHSETLIKDLFTSSGAVNDDQISNIISDSLDEAISVHENSLSESQASDADVASMNAQFSDLFTQIFHAVFGQRPIVEDHESKFQRLAALVTLVHPGMRKTGLVIAGYGSREIYPSVLSFELTKLLNGKIESSPQNQSVVSLANQAIIAPFAQSGEVHSFLRGIGNQVQSFFDGPMRETLTSTFPETLAQVAKKDLGLSDDQIAKLHELAAGMGKGAYDNISGQLGDISRKEYVSPVVSTLIHLPVNELAVMAETFINLESFRKRVTMNAESVGGPIDVATITKGDGFVWIKRKHYFKPELNHHFFTNYYRGGQ